MNAYDRAVAIDSSSANPVAYLAGHSHTMWPEAHHQNMKFLSYRSLDCMIASIMMYSVYNAASLVGLELLCLCVWIPTSIMMRVLLFLVIRTSSSISAVVECSYK